MPPRQTSRHHSQRFYTLPQLKDYSGLGERFLREAIRDNTHPLPHFRLNRKTILVCADDFEGWLQHYRVDDDAALDRLVDEVMTGL